MVRSCGSENPRYNGKFGGTGWTLGSELVMERIAKKAREKLDGKPRKKNTGRSKEVMSN